MGGTLNTVNYKKGIIFLVSGIIALVVSQLLGESSEFYGFLLGYGYMATVGGVAGLGFLFVKTNN